MEFSMSVLLLGLMVNLQWSRGFENIATTDNLHTMDFCNMEYVNLTCNRINEPKVILVRVAKYGRMRLGRCVLRDLGYLGCSDDSTHILDSRCSGRSECSFKLPDPELFNLQSCPSDVTPYLQVEFSCVPVISKKQSACFSAESIKITNEHRYLSNFINNQTPTDLHIHKLNNNNINTRRDPTTSDDQKKCYYVIEASPGQQINLTLFNFFDSNQFALKLNSTSISDVQPPVFSYSPNYQNHKNYHEFASSAIFKDRHGKRSLKDIDNQSISAHPEKDRTLTDKRLLPITDDMIKNSFESKSKQTGSSDLPEVKSLDVVKDSFERANQPFPQMSAQLGLYSPLHKSTHHLQKARICIEVAYVNELPSDKTPDNRPRYKRNATGREIRDNNRGDVHYNETETTQSREFLREKIIYDRSFYEYDLLSLPKQSIERRRRSSTIDRRPISICEDDPRIVHVLITRSNRLRIEVRNQLNIFKGRQGAYMLKFEAIGCQDPEPISGAWFHRHGNSLSVTCNHSSDVTYHVTCKNEKWIGQIGNCSQTGKSILKLNQKSTKEDYFPFGILIMVVVGVAIGIVVGGMFLCVVVACTKNCSSPSDMHTAAEYQSILVNNSSLSTTTSTTTKVSDHHQHQQQQQKHQHNNRSTTTNWSVSDYYPPLNQQSTLALADYNYFRDTGYNDALQQSETRPSDDVACPRDHHHHHHLYHHRHHHQEQMFPKCCTYNPEGLFDSSANEESMISCDAQSSVKCHPHKDIPTAAPATIVTSSIISSSSSSSTTPFKTFKSTFCPKTTSTKFFTPTSVVAMPDGFIDSQSCNNCRDLSRDGIVVETACSYYSRKDDLLKHDNSTFIAPSFHLQSLKPDLTQLNN